MVRRARKIYTTRTRCKFVWISTSRISLDRSFRRAGECPWLAAKSQPGSSSAEAIRKSGGERDENLILGQLMQSSRAEGSSSKAAASYPTRFFTLHVRRARLRSVSRSSRTRSLINSALSGSIALRKVERNGLVLPRARAFGSRHHRRYKIIRSYRDCSSRKRGRERERERNSSTAVCITSRNTIFYYVVSRYIVIICDIVTTLCFPSLSIS